MRLLVWRFSMRNSARIASLFLTLLSLGSISLGCTRKKLEAKFALQVQLASEPVSLDPSLAEDGASMRVLANVMDGLLCHDGQGKLRNCLAQSFQVSPDGKR